MPRRIFLHIGYDKTGTTSLQRFFSKHVDNLPHILFPVLDGSFSPKRKVEFSHHLFAEAFAGQLHQKRVINASRLIILQKEMPDLTIDDVLDGFKKQLDNVEDDNRPAVISSEVFSRETFNHKKLYEFLKEYDVTIVAFLRRQDEYAKSKYSQHIKHKSRLKKNLNAKKFADFLDPQWLDFHSKMVKWVEAGFEADKIKIIPFERERMPNGVIPYFFEQLDLDMLNLPIESFDVNKSLSDFEVLALQWFLSRTDVDDDKKRNAVLAAIKHSGELEGLQNVSFINKRVRKKILKTYEKSNAKLIEDFMPNHKGSFFSDIIPEDKAGLEKLDMSKVKSYIEKLGQLPTE